MAIANSASGVAPNVFQKNMELAAQQLQSRFRMFADVMTGATGKAQTHRKVGKEEMDLETSRIADTGGTEATYYSRVVTPSKGVKTSLVDEDDQATLDIDVSPGGSLLTTHQAAAGRFVDRYFIAGLTGSNTELDLDGNYSTIALPSTQKVAVNYGGSNVGMTLAKLVKAKSIFGVNEAWGQGQNSDPNARLCIAVSQRQLDDMLNSVTQVGSSDYNKVKALVDGEVEYFMGIYFLRSEQLTKTSIDGTYESVACPMWVSTGVHLDFWYDVKTSITVRNDKSEALQVRSKIKFGVSRKDEDRVVEVSCQQTKL